MRLRNIIPAISLLCATALHAQERPLPTVVRNDSAAVTLRLVPPMDYSMVWLKEANDPFLQERRRLKGLMERSSEQSLLLKPQGDASTDLNKRTGLWRITIGNTSADNWSPFPDRSLDARTLRFPLPKNLNPDHRKK